MSSIQFILHSPQDSAVNDIQEIKQYLKDNWDATVTTKLADNSDTTADTRAIELDADSLKVLIEVAVGFKLAVDSAHGLLETRTKLKELMTWAEQVFTDDFNYLWLEIGGIPYPVKIDELENILTAMQE